MERTAHDPQKRLVFLSLNDVNRPIGRQSTHKVLCSQISDHVMMFEQRTPVGVRPCAKRVLK